MKRTLGWLLAVPLALNAQRFAKWEQYLGGADSSQYSSLKQINRTNIGKLKLAWSFPTGDGLYRFNPIIVDGVMYVLANDDAIVALNAATGKELWRHPNQGAVGNRGMNYWESKDRADRRLLYINAGFLTAINARTGLSIDSFGQSGRVDLRKALHRDITNVRPLHTNNPGRIFEDLMIVALPASGAGYVSTPGDIQAYDVRTGALKWVFHTVPEPGEFGADTWPKEMLADAGGIHSWSELTVDATRGMVYVPLGSPRYDFYGGNRHGANLFGDSLVALDARTGKRVWHQQLVHHDLWDYDLPTAPKLLTVRHNGRRVDVVAQATKWGYLYVFDRVTGEPLWPIEERTVAQSDIPGEKTWPTQPIPTVPPPFARPSFSIGDINPLLPASEQAALRTRFQTLRDAGLFTPPSLEGSLRNAGGSSWGGAAVDPTKGTLYVVSQELPTVVTLYPLGRGASGKAGQKGKAGKAGNAPPAPAPNANPEFIAYNSPMEFLFAANGLSTIAPPWSQMTAYDLNAGTILWKVPNGEISGLVEQGVRATGSHTPRSGPLATAGGLIFMGTSSDRKLRAYDQANGKVLWQLDLPSATEGVPATYEIAGRQYLVVCVGAASGTFPPRVGAQPPPGPGQYMVFALPK